MRCSVARVFHYRNSSNGHILNKIVPASQNTRLKYIPKEIKCYRHSPSSLSPDFLSPSSEENYPELAHLIPMHSFVENNLWFASEFIEMIL